MTPDLLICWYALGWTACGFDFATRDAGRYGYLICFAGGPVIGLFAAVLLFGYGLFRIVKAASPSLDTSKQYLWRRP